MSARSSTAAAEEAPEASSPGFEILREQPPQGLVRRFVVTHKHLTGFAFGALVAHVREGTGGIPGFPELSRKRGFRLLFQLERLLAWTVRPFLDKTLRDQPFPVQLRRRLE